MICYEAEFTEEEILAVNDYWLLSDEDNEFKYTVNEINHNHKEQTKRTVMSLIKSSFYFLDLPGFVCQNCKSISPATSRTDYKRRIEIKSPQACKKCLQEIRRKETEKAQQVLDRFRADVFKTTDYLDKLTAVDLLVTLSLISNLTGDDEFLGNSFQSVAITGVEAVDATLLRSLLEKGVLSFIDEIPSDVKDANDLLNPVDGNLIYLNRLNGFQDDTYHPPGSLRLGFYLNLPMLEGCEVSLSSIDNVFDQQLRLCSFSIDDTQVVHDIAKYIQSKKLYLLLEKVQEEYKITIDHSAPLASLIDHLSENYAPMYLNYTFNIMGNQTAAYLHKESRNPYAAKHYFTSKVGKYIQGVETNGWPLNKTWSLPAEFETSFFEAYFSQVYLNGHFDWNKLSAKEVVALWLENVTLVEETRDLPAS